MPSLPLKVDIHSNELLSSWVTRLANENTMMVAALLATIGYERKIQTDFDLYTIPDLIGILGGIGFSGDQHRLQKTMIASWGEKTGTLRQCMRRWILPAGHRHSRLRFCPLCLLENPYYRKTWRINWYAACHKHKIILRDHCHICLSPQILYRAPWKNHIGCCTNCHQPLSSLTDTIPFDDANYWHSIAVAMNKLRPSTSQQLAVPWFQSIWTLAKWLEKLRAMGKSQPLFSAPLESMQSIYPEAVAFHRARILWDEEPFQLQQLINSFSFEFDRITYHRCPRPLKSYRRSKDWRIPSIELLEDAVQEIRKNGEDVTYLRVSEVAGCCYETLRKYTHLDEFMQQHICKASKVRLRQ